MIPTARVQRGPSEAARCASTGIVPGHPDPFFNILLKQRLLLLQPFDLTHQLLYSILKTDIVEPK